MQVVRGDIGVPAAIIGGEVIVVSPDLDYVHTYSAIRALLPLASPEAIMALTEQVSPRLRLLRSVE